MDPDAIFYLDYAVSLLSVGAFWATGAFCLVRRPGASLFSSPGRLRLAGGSSLSDAVRRIDAAATDRLWRLTGRLDAAAVSVSR